MGATPSVAVVVVNYRGREDTLACLESLAALTFPRWWAIVVDQNSGDGLPAAVRARFPETVVLECGRNTGFAEGNNHAIERAFAGGADYVFLLNNDTRVAPDLLDYLVAFAEAHPEVGAAGPLALCWDAPDSIWAAGGGMDRLGHARLLRHGEPAAAGGAAVAVDYVVGCGLLTSRRALEAVGVLDERYFLYYEEADLCARLRAAGRSCVVVPAARLWHKGSASTGADSMRTLYYMRRNRLLYLRKHGGRGAVARALAEDLRLWLVWSLRRDPRRRVLAEAAGDFLAGRLGPSANFSPDAS